MAIGESCSFSSGSDDCSAAGRCTGWGSSDGTAACRKLCTADDDCESSDGCREINGSYPPTPRTGVCVPKCDPLGPADACGEGVGCYVLRSAHACIQRSHPPREHRGYNPAPAASNVGVTNGRKFDHVASARPLIGRRWRIDSVPVGGWTAWQAPRILHPLIRVEHGLGRHVVHDHPIAQLLGTWRGKRESPAATSRMALDARMEICSPTPRMNRGSVAEFDSLARGARERFTAPVLGSRGCWEGPCKDER